MSTSTSATVSPSITNAGHCLAYGDATIHRALVNTALSLLSPQPSESPLIHTQPCPAIHEFEWPSAGPAGAFRPDIRVRSFPAPPPSLCLRCDERAGPHSRRRALCAAGGVHQPAFSRRSTCCSTPGRRGAGDHRPGDEGPFPPGSTTMSATSNAGSRCGSDPAQVRVLNALHLPASIRPQWTQPQLAVMRFASADAYFDAGLPLLPDTTYLSPTTRGFTISWRSTATRRRPSAAQLARHTRPWTAIPVHPLLVAAYPIVFLFATNAADQVTIDPMWAPLAMPSVARRSCLR